MLLTARHTTLRHARAYYQSIKRSKTAQVAPLARLLSTLVLLEQREGKLQEQAALSAVTAAQKLNGPITGFIAGSGIRPVAEQASKVKALEKIIVVENGAYDKV